MVSLKHSAEITRFERKLTKELLWLYILSLLKKESLHAYAIRKKISKKFSFLPGNVSAYVVLYKLKKRGFVSKKKDGMRIVYSITPKGKTLLKEAEKSLKQKLKLVF